MDKKWALVPIAIIIIAVTIVIVNTSAEETCKADSFESLSLLTQNGEKEIEITANIELSAPIFITSETKIFSTKDVTLKRSINYSGELFIIGENQDHSKPIISGKKSILTLGNNNPKKGIITVDGNQEVNALGSMFLVVASGELAIYNDCILQNGHKTGNERLLDSEHYITSSPESIGGAAVDIISGVFNMYGGSINNCKSSLDVNNASYLGGAIYNYGDFNMYGGSINKNESARGGAIYNYKTVRINSGSILNNNATSYGGGICCANSQYVNVYLGDKQADDGTVLIQGNTSEGAGAAIYAKQKCSIVSYGGVTFKNNTSSSHGGAMYIAGTLWINNTVFEGNKAKSQGGAIQIHDVEDYTPRNVTITNSTFTNNKAGNGGGIFSKTKGILDIDNCNFQYNSASGSGGSLYASASSNILMTNVQAKNNEANDKGGFLFITDANTEVSIISGTVEENKAQLGEFIYGNNENSTVKIGKLLKYNGSKEGQYTEVVI